MQTPEQQQNAQTAASGGGESGGADADDGYRSGDDNYRLLLPHPKTILKLADGWSEIDETSALRHTLETVAQIKATDKDEVVQHICDEMIQRFQGSNTNPAPIQNNTKEFAYDLYFEVERLPESANKIEALNSLALVWAVTLRDVLKQKKVTQGVTAFEFSVLRQAYATVLEIIANELTNNL